MKLDDSKIMYSIKLWNCWITKHPILLKVTCLEFQAEHVDPTGMDPSHLAAEVGLFEIINFHLNFYKVGPKGQL